MSVFFRSVPHRFPRATLLGAFLLVMVPLAAWLGYEAVHAARSHRQAAEAALRDYAQIAVWEYTREVRDDLDDLLDRVFQPVHRRLGENRPLPSPDVVGWRIDEALRDEGCPCPSFRDGLEFFSFDGRNGSVRTSRGTMSPAEVRELAGSVERRRPDVRRRDEGILVRSVADGPEPAFVAYTIWKDSIGGVNGVLGFVAPVAALGELLGESYRDERLLPDPIGRGRPNDSLVYVAVHGRDSLLLFDSPQRYETAITATESLGAQLDELSATTAVRADAAGQLVIGGLPKSRLPLLLTLLLATMGVVAASLVQLRREQEFQRLRDDFVSGVSHELRTPLAQIRMFAELQEAEKLPSDEDRRRAVSVIHREARRLSYLVDNVLQFSRLRHPHRVAIPTDDLDLTDALAEGVDAMRPVFDERSMTLDVEAESDVRVVANRDAITRIVVNLLDNASKYGPVGQTVRVRVERVDGSARLSVADEGPGVPEDQRARIWRPYRRLERDVKASQPGTGIGLAVVRDLAAVLGGTVRVDESGAGGALFSVDLSLASSDRGARAAGGAADVA